MPLQRESIAHLVFRSRHRSGSIEKEVPIGSQLSQNEQQLTPVTPDLATLAAASKVKKSGSNIYEVCLKTYENMFMFDWDLKEFMNSRHSPSKYLVSIPLRPGFPISSMLKGQAAMASTWFGPLCLYFALVSLTFSAKSDPWQTNYFI